MHDWRHWVSLSNSTSDIVLPNIQPQSTDKTKKQKNWKAKAAWYSYNGFGSLLLPIPRFWPWQLLAALEVRIPVKDMQIVTAFQ